MNTANEWLNTIFFIVFLIASFGLCWYVMAHVLLSVIKDFRK
jgi:hypothetical protein